ncbi:MAG: response regulator [Clostridiaceae bacterium]
MYKILVADDEDMIREGIALGVPWSELGFEVSGQAVNGIEAIDLIKRDTPDVVITDIRMPKMDGIELIEYLSVNYPRVKTIIISGYSDIEYFKSAINNRVFEYLLKPTDYNEFEQVFKHVKDALDEERRKKEEYDKLKSSLIESLPYMRERFLNQLIKGYYTDVKQISDKLIFYEVNLDYNELAVIVFEIDNYFVLTNGYSEEVKELLRLSVILTANNVFGEKQPGIFFSGSNDEIIGICDLKDGYKAIVPAINEVQKRIYEYKKVTVSAGISDKCVDIMHISLSYRQAIQAIKQKVFLGSESIIFFSDINMMDCPDYLPYLFDNERLINAVFYKDGQELTSFLDDVFSQFESKMIIKYDNIDRLCMEMLFIVARHAVQYNIKLEEILEARGTAYSDVYHYDSLPAKKEYVRDILTEVNNKIRQIRNDSASHTIGIIKDYLDKNFSNNCISLDLVAEKVNKNPAYVSYLFKNETGKNFTEYVTELRINKAKGLLSDVRVKLYEISAMVGYADASHFTKIFKKYTGLIPSEYRKMTVSTTTKTTVLS